MATRMISFVLFFIFFWVRHSAQLADTILVYDIATQTTATILPVTYDSTAQNDGTSSFVGSLGNNVSLPLNPPTTSLFSGSNFSKLARASDFFNVATYPARTAVSIQSFSNGVATKGCTGMIVSSNFVLTLGYCVYYPFADSFAVFDSLKVIPAFNNGLPQPGIPVSLVKKIFIFKSFANNGTNDVALLQLKAPIGLTTGWTGIGFNSTPNFISNNVFHKFSYPSAPSPADSNIVYDGDTLYYNYGKITEYGTWYGVGSQEAFGIPGQGGSTFMMTDNNNDYYNIALFEYSTNYMHCKITNAIFHQFQSVMENNFITSITESNLPDQTGMRLYPNPFSSQAVFEFSRQAGKTYTLKIINALGELVEEIIPLGDRVFIERKNKQSGVYFLQLSGGQGPSLIKKMIVD